MNVRELSYLRSHLVSADLVQRDDRHALLQPSILEKILSDFLVLDYDVIELSSSRDFESGGLVKVCRIKRNQRRH